MKEPTPEEKEVMRRLLADAPPWVNNFASIVATLILISIVALVVAGIWKLIYLVFVGA